MKKQPRIPPRPPSDWDDEGLDALSVIMRRSEAEALQRSERGLPRGANVLGLLVRYPSLAKAFLTFNRHLLSDSSLSVRIRELLILRVSWLRRAEYEWAQHVLAAERAGVRKDEIEAVKEGAEASLWPPFEAALIRAVDELHRDAFVADGTWEVLAANLDQRQLMDLVFTVGAYDLLAMVFNTFELELEPGLVGFDG